MIQSRADLKKYIELDQQASGRASACPSFFGDECWKFQLLLRYCEYFHNNKHRRTNYLLFLLFKYFLHSVSIKLGFSISLNTIGPGLYLPHKGTIVINDKAQIGKNCRIHVCVNIGEGADHKAPIIGDNVYIGPGAKIFGAIKIANNVTIGANAVVNKSIAKENCTVVGIPAKVVKYDTV